MTQDEPRRAVSSAPGKIYLSGEHAVVHGELAIPCAIERRAMVTVDPRDDGRVRVSASDLSLSNFTVEYEQLGETLEPPRVDAPSGLVKDAMRYVNSAVAQARDALNNETAGFDITVESEIPLGAGLGSSAAVVVAGIDAATRAYGVELAKDELADRAYTAESDVQNGNASRADTFCSTMGGAASVNAFDCEQLQMPSEVPSFVIGYDGDSGDTGALVSGVQDRMKHGSVKSTIRTIGDVSGEVRGWFRAAEVEDGQPSDELLDELGHSMDVNHGLLSAIGVSARSLDEMVWAAREAGARGAKMTGAGGGGCIVALPEGDVATIERALEVTPACEQVFQVDVALTGVRVIE